MGNELKLLNNQCGPELSDVVSKVLSVSYPLSFSCLGEDVWDELISRFLRKSVISPDSLSYTPQEFYGFVVRSRISKKILPPVARDLLKFEAVEIEINQLKTMVSPIKEDGGGEDENLLLNPWLKLVQFNYPVFKYSPDLIRESDLNDYFVCAYRHPDTGIVNFFELSALYAHAFELLLNGYLSPRALTQALMAELGEMGPQAQKRLISMVQNFLSILMDRRVILGFVQHH